MTEKLGVTEKEPSAAVCYSQCRYPPLPRLYSATAWYGASSSISGAILNTRLYFFLLFLNVLYFVIS